MLAPKCEICHDNDIQLFENVPNYAQACLNCYLKWRGGRYTWSTTASRICYLVWRT